MGTPNRALVQQLFYKGRFLEEVGCVYLNNLVARGWGKEDIPER